jgi:hypothetical protein
MSLDRGLFAISSAEEKQKSANTPSSNKIRNIKSIQLSKWASTYSHESHRALCSVDSRHDTKLSKFWLRCLGSRLS